MTLRLHDYEEAQLVALVADAWEASGEEREAAVARLLDWRDGIIAIRARRLLWRREERQQRLLAVVRETDPRRLGGRPA